MFFTHTREVKTSSSVVKNMNIKHLFFVPFVGHTECVTCYQNILLYPPDRGLSSG